MKKFLFMVFTFSASIVVGLFLAEGALRLFTSKLPPSFLVYLHEDLKNLHPSVWPVVREQVPLYRVRIPDPDMGWTFVPNLRVSDKNEDGEDYDVQFSGQGFYTPDSPPFSQPPLVILGDSFLSTYYAREPIPDAIKRKLEKPIYNLSSQGWGPMSYLAAYRKFGRPAKPKLVVLFSFLNDISDVNNWRQWQVQYAEQMTFMDWLVKFQGQGQLNIATSWQDRNSILWNLGKFVLQRKRPVAKINVEPQQITVEGSTHQYYLSHSMAFMQFTPKEFLPSGQYFQYMEAYYRVIHQIQKEVEKDGGRLVFVWIPSKERVLLPFLSGEKQAQYVEHGQKIDGVEQSLQLFAAEEGVTFLDLTSALQKQAQMGQKLYFTKDGHLNSAGNMFVGEYVADFLLNLPAAPSPKRLDMPLLVSDEILTKGDSLLEVGPSYKQPQVKASIESLTIDQRLKTGSEYLIKWDRVRFDKRGYLVAKGQLESGPIVIGLLKDNKWFLQKLIRYPGSFEEYIRVPSSGDYDVVISGGVQAGEPVNVVFDRLQKAYARF